MNDASFLIFHAGNLEFIGIRHRQSQTLYISRLIDVPDDTKLPAYNRIHVGLFIASYKDTLARTKILHEWRTQASRNENEYPLYTITMITTALSTMESRSPGSENVELNSLTLTRCGSFTFYTSFVLFNRTFY